MTRIRLSLPVTVILERRIIRRSFWSVPSWYLHSVAVGENVSAARSAAGAAVPMGQSGQGDLFGWSGLQVTLYKDACERYWHGLIGDRPLVYVVCRDDADSPVEAAEGDASSGLSLKPRSVTIDYDEATSAVETDDLVLSCPIPPELYRYMEDFVLQHYQPKAFRKRKRRDWSEENGAEGRGAGEAPDSSGMPEPRS